MEVSKGKTRKRMSSRHYYFTDADESFVRDPPNKRRSPVDKYNFRQPDILIPPLKYDKDDVPFAFRVSPESLVDMTTKIIQKWKLPSVYTWSVERVCQWIREYGYPQYQNIFRGNLINGRTLILVDASALPAMNIKDFDHIRHIAYGIRCLFNFEVATFARSISLPPHNYLELYKLFRVKNGVKYERTNIVDLWRHMKLASPPNIPADHWQTLEQSLGQQPEPPLIRIGRTIKKKPEEFGKLEAAIDVQYSKICSCVPPCECEWTERNLRQPWNLKHLAGVQLWQFQKTTGVLLILKKLFPERYNTIQSRPMLSL